MEANDGVRLWGSVHSGKDNLESLKRKMRALVVDATLVIVEFSENEWDFL